MPVELDEPIPVPDLVQYLRSPSYDIVDDNRLRWLGLLNDAPHLYDWTHMIVSYANHERISTAMGLRDFNLVAVIGGRVSEEGNHLWIMGKRSNLRRWSEATGYVYEENDANP